MENKEFDCVEMKRKGSRKVYEALKGLTRDQQIEYWRGRNAEMRKWLEEIKANPTKTACQK